MDNAVFSDDGMNPGTPTYTTTTSYGNESGEDNVVEHITEDLGTDNISKNVDNVYPMKTIKVDKGFYTIFELKRKYEKEPMQIILDSDFQRNSVWKRQQKRELIESVLMGLPLPIFYFNEDKQGRLIVIDGRQRLSAFFEFMDPKKGFALDGLKILPDLNGYKFKDLDGNLQSKIEDYQIMAHVIQPPTPDRVKFDIFDRVNRAGTQLNKQEIRNALYQGIATRLLLDLSRLPEFEVATEGAFKQEKRMKDRYILLRFIAFFLYYQQKFVSKTDGTSYQYNGDIDDFLGMAMDYLNEHGENMALQIKQVVLDSLKKVIYYVGENAFRLTEQINGELKRYPININIFETLMYGMTLLPADNSSIRAQVKLAIENLKTSNTFLDSLYNHRDSVPKVSARFLLIKKIVEDIKGD